MARAKQAAGGEDSFYDAFLSSTDQAPGEPAEAPVATTVTAREGTPRKSRSAPTAPAPAAEKAGATTSATPTAEPPEQMPGRPDEPRAGATVDGRSATDPSKTRSNGRGVGRRSDPDYMQASSYMLRRMRRQVDRALLNDPSERDYSELIEELVREWLERQGMSA